MEIIQQILDIILPESFDPAAYFMNLLIAIVGILVVVGIFRLCFGKGSILNGAISSAIAILSLYVINVLIYSFGSSLTFLFEPLPFVEVAADQLTVFPIMGASFEQICAEIVSMMILAFLMNLLETWLPKGNKVWSWFCFRFLALSIAVCLHYCIDLLLNSVLQENALVAAPLILLGIVLAAFALACLKMLIGGALSFINPLLGLFHSFFFKQDVGKQLLRAMITTALLTALVYALNYLSYTGISIAAVAVVTYLPVILLGLALWYIISKFL
jgi:putative flippase GtrA